MIIVPLADYTGREEIENGKLDESCGCVGSTLFFVLSELKEKKKKWLTFIHDYSYTVSQKIKLLLHPRRSMKKFWIFL